MTMAKRHSWRGHRTTGIGLATGALLAGLGLSAGSGCDTGATAEEACWEIEKTRCELAMGCPGSVVENEDDVESCKLFYRDQCLFGMADEANPDSPQVQACLAALRNAKACWEMGLTLGECNAVAQDAGVAAAITAGWADPNISGCDAILYPEFLYSCAFLAVPGLDPTPIPIGGSAPTGNGGAGGAGGG